MNNKQKKHLQEGLLDNAIDYITNVMKKAQLDKLKKQTQKDHPEIAQAVDKLKTDMKKLNDMMLNSITDIEIDYDKPLF